MLVGELRDRLQQVARAAEAARDAAVREGRHAKAELVRAQEAERERAMEVERCATSSSRWASARRRAPR